MSLKGRKKIVKRGRKKLPKDVSKSYYIGFRVTVVQGKALEGIAKKRKQKSVGNMIRKEVLKLWF